MFKVLYDHCCEKHYHGKTKHSDIDLNLYDSTVLVCSLFTLFDARTQRMTTHCTIARLVFVLVSTQPHSYYCTSDLHISYVGLPYPLNAIIKDSVPLQYIISLAACGMLNGTPATIDSCQLLP